MDNEADGQPSALATGDDIAGAIPFPPGDEDGVVFTSTPPLVTCETANVTLSASAPGLLNAWVDFNDNGSWADPGEQIFTDVALVAGVNALSFTVPCTATPTSLTFARFRFDSAGGLSFDGPANDGEVEDYALEINGLDYGDAPDPTYPTLRASNGARHVLSIGPFLGVAVDHDPDGQPDATATGDDNDGNDDEDGVTFVTLIVPGTSAQVDVTTTAGGLLNAWIDWNQDGDWADAGEQIFTDQALAAGLNSLSFSVPAGSVLGTTSVRFRFDQGGGLSFDGLAPDGEVEDYQVQVQQLSCSIDPPTDTNLVGQTHNMVVSVLLDGVGAANVPVNLDVLSGPHTGLNLDGATGPDGSTILGYPGPNPGTDEIRISGTFQGVGFECFAEKIWIEDSTPPLITCPGDTTVACSGPGQGRVVEFEATATDDLDPDPEVVCDPPSGSLFPIGINPVVCIATDHAGNASQCSFTVTVLEPCTEIGVEAPSPMACVGDTVSILVSAENCGTVNQDFELDCQGPCVLPPPGYGFHALDIPPGGSAMFEVRFVCQNPGEIPYNCIITTSLSASPECRITSNISGVVTECKQPCVDLALTKQVACVGGSIEARGAVANCSPYVEDLVVNCTVGGSPIPPVMFEDVESGGTREFSFPVLCEVEGTIDIECTVIATVDGLPGCTMEVTRTSEVQCIETCLWPGSASAVDACLGEETPVPVDLTNCSSGPEDFVVTAELEGVEIFSKEVNAVPAGEMVTVAVPVTCDTPGDAMLGVYITAYPAGNRDPACAVEKSRWITVRCKEACAEIRVSEGMVCVGNMIDLPVWITNCSTGPADLAVTCLINGEPGDQWFFENVEPGESEHPILWFMCEDAGDLEVECVVTATLVEDPNCTGEDTYAVTVACPLACVDISHGVCPAAPAPGTQVLIPFTALQCGTGNADVTITCTIDPGIDPAPMTYTDVAPGTVINLNVPLNCYEGYTYTITCIAEVTSLELSLCGSADTSAVIVQCFTPECEIDIDDGAGCTGTEVLLPVTVTNTAIGTEDIEISWAGDGLGHDPVLLEAMDPGETRQIEAPVTPAGPGEAAIVFTAICSPTGDPTRTAEETVEATLTGHLACVSASAVDATACVGQTYLFPVEVTNCATDVADLEVTVTLDGFVLDPVSFPGVPVGESRIVEIPIQEEDEGSLQLICEATAVLPGAPGCTASVIDTATVICEICTTLGAEGVLPTAVLLRAYPNPVYQGATTVEYGVPEGRSGNFVSLSVYDIQGRRILDLVSEPRPAGLYAVSWDLRDSAGAPVPAGIYFYRLAVGPEHQTGRLIVVRQ